MATNNPTIRRHGGATIRRFIRQHRGLIAAAVEGVGVLLPMPAVVHVILTVVMQLAIGLLTAPSRRR